MKAILEPGMLVRHPLRQDWGLGQVQSVIAARVTVNFVDSNNIALVPDFGACRP